MYELNIMKEASEILEYQSGEWPKIVLESTTLKGVLDEISSSTGLNCSCFTLL